MAKRVWRKFLGLDVGEKRIGMSLASEELVIAIPYGFLDVNNMESAKAIGKILTVVLSEEIDIIVVGRPRNNEGLLTAQTVVVEQFIKDLKSALKDLGKKKGRKLKGFVEELEIKYSESDLLSFQEADNIKVIEQDESLTSVMAEEVLKSHKKPYTKGDIDAQAATIILQDYLEAHIRRGRLRI